MTPFVRALVCAALCGLGCAQPQPVPQLGPPRYAVSCTQRGMLNVTVHLPAGSPRVLEWGRGRARLDGLASEPEESFEATASGVKLAGGVTEFRYRYRLGGEANPLGGTGANGSFVVDGSAYLALPRQRDRVELEFEGPVALPGGATAAGRTLLSGPALEHPGFHVFGVEARELSAPVAARLALLKGTSTWDATALEAWVVGTLNEVHAVLPATPAFVIVQPRSGSGVGMPILLPSSPTSVLVPVGQATTDFTSDRVLLRALCRAALPKAPPGAPWLREGAATYLLHLAAWRSGRFDDRETLLALRAGSLRAKAEAGRDSLRLLSRVPGSAESDAVRFGGALLMLDLDLRLHARGATLEQVLHPLCARGRITVETFAAQVDTVGGAGLFAQLESAHLSGPTAGSAEAIFTSLGLDPSGSFDPAIGADARSGLVAPPK